MNKFGVHSKLTKEYILDRISQEDIFSHFLEVSRSDIDYCIQNSSYLIRSTIRKDKEPTCGFKYSGTKLRYRDFSGFFWGDCFDLVGFLNNLNSNDKIGFAKILVIIAKEFKIHDYEVDDVPILKASNFSLPATTQRQVKTIRVKIRDWNEIDAKFWGSIFLNRFDLKQANIYACQLVSINDEIYYDYDEVHLTDVAYCYYFGKTDEGVDIIKIYYPYRKTHRFTMNVPVMEGLKDMIPSEVGVITKSYKDTIAIRKLVRDRFPIDSTNLPAEGFLLTKEDYHTLWTMHEQLVTLFDFDFAGRNSAWKHRVTYNIPSLFFTNGKIKTINYHAKDFSEYLAKNGEYKTLKLIEQSYQYITKKYLSKKC